MFRDLNERSPVCFWTSWGYKVYIRMIDFLQAVFWIKTHCATGKHTRNHKYEDDNGNNS